MSTSEKMFSCQMERVRQHEIQINCAFCPPPRIKKIAEVEGLPGQDRRSSTPNQPHLHSSICHPHLMNPYKATHKYGTVFDQLKSDPIG